MKKHHIIVLILILIALALSYKSDRADAGFQGSNQITQPPLELIEE